MKLRQVQVLLRLENGCHRHFLGGVSRFASTAGWDIEVSFYEYTAGGAQFDRRSAGMLVPHGLREDFERNQPITCPAVFFGSQQVPRPDRPEPYQWFPDDALVGKMAAEHFLECGFTRFAYAHHDVWPCSQARGEAFRERLHQAGLTCEWLDIKPQMTAAHQAGLLQMARRLRRLPRPIALFAINDMTAAFLARALQRSRLKFPGDVALLGVDNDDLLCDSLSPTLSSVDTAWGRMGFEAAQGLDRLMRGEGLQQRSHPVAPDRIAVRNSTGFLVFPDRLVVDALCFIRENLEKGVGVDDVLRHTLVSRPTLDKRFRQYLGHTASDEIQRARLERARHLLKYSSQSIEQIAHACGYAYPDVLFRNFRLAFHCTPAEFRKNSDGL